MQSFFGFDRNVFILFFDKSASVFAMNFMLRIAYMQMLANITGARRFPCNASLEQQKCISEFV